jgi:glycosyltransferase involved in cell wall biosynthesis
MRIAMDEQIFAVQEFGGISRQFSELAEQFTTDPSHDVALQPLNAPVVNHYLLDNPALVTALKVKRAPGSYSALFHYFAHGRRKAEIDLVHSTFYLPRGLADYPGVPMVMTVHDMIPEIIPNTRRRLDFITMKRRYIAKASHIICVSESTKRDVLRIYGQVDAPITVVHHGVAEIFRPDVARIPGFPDEYLVFVGNRGGYKDANTLLRAFKVVHGEFPDFSLIFVGGGAFTKSEVQEIANLGLSQKVHQVSLTEGEMAGAYAHATVCVFPSQYEGFGLPALEAMACGTALVLADSSSLPEVGGEAACYFPPGDSVKLSEQLQWLLSEPRERERLSTLGLIRAKEFTWGRTASETAKVYARTINEFSGSR